MFESRGDRGPGRRRRHREVAAPGRVVDYGNLKNPFPPIPAFAEDRIEAMRQTALQVLEELGIKVLLPEARDLLAWAGAILKGEDMVHIGRDTVTAALKSAPHATDRERGRGPGTLKDFRGLSDDEFRVNPQVYAIVNTNTPRQIDIPVAQGAIDFARHGQPIIVTPFTLIGAMAPITVAGTLTLFHAEALAAITLAQLAHPGASVTHGTFTSNVDMKSGAPAFGTPVQVMASPGAGQLARRIGLPWRCAAGSAANLADAQAAHETEISAWGAVLAGATVVTHAAGWLEGGLTMGYEKPVTDMGDTFAELCMAAAVDEAAIGLDALREAGGPGGYFFGARHRMERFQTAFRELLSRDWSTHGTWADHGAQDAQTRVTTIWKRRLAEFTPPAHDPGRVGALRDFIAKRSAQGGAAPVSQA